MMDCCDISGLTGLHLLNLNTFADMSQITSGLVGHRDRLIGSMNSHPNFAGVL